MGGLQASDLNHRCGRPAMGKSALATNIAYHVAKHYRAEHLGRVGEGAGRRRGGTVLT